MESAPWQGAPLKQLVLTTPPMQGRSEPQVQRQGVPQLRYRERRCGVRLERDRRMSLECGCHWNRRCRADLTRQRRSVHVDDCGCPCPGPKGYRVL